MSLLVVVPLITASVISAYILVTVLALCSELGKEEDETFRRRHQRDQDFKERNRNKRQRMVRVLPPVSCGRLSSPVGYCRIITELHSTYQEVTLLLW